MANSAKSKIKKRHKGSVVKQCCLYCRKSGERRFEMQAEEKSLYEMFVILNELQQTGRDFILHVELEGGEKTGGKTEE